MDRERERHTQLKVEFQTISRRDKKSFLNEIWKEIKWERLVQFSSVTQSCPTLCDPMNYSTPGLPIHHQLLESTQTHVHCASDAIQPSHPLLSPSPPALNLSQHQDIFKWVNPLHQVSKVLEFQLQHQSFQRTPRTDLLRMNWLDILAVQGNLMSLLLHHSSKASIFQCSAVFTVHLSSIHDHWKNHSLD